MRDIIIFLGVPILMFGAVIAWDRLNWYLSTHIKWLAECESKEWQEAFFKNKSKEGK